MREHHADERDEEQDADREAEDLGDAVVPGTEGRHLIGHVRTLRGTGPRLVEARMHGHEEERHAIAETLDLRRTVAERFKPRANP